MSQLQTNLLDRKVVVEKSDGHDMYYPEYPIVAVFVAKGRLKISYATDKRIVTKDAAQVKLKETKAT